jgi:hypothetical protein
LSRCIYYTCTCCGKRVTSINSSIPTRKNLTRWGLVSSPECSFCLCPETLLHVVVGCQSYLQRFTWRHDSTLNFLAETFKTTNPCRLYADLCGYKSPSINDIYRPDLLLITPNEDDLYVVEPTVGFESNLHNNVERKKAKCKDLIEDQRGHFSSAKFIHLSKSSLGVFDKQCFTFLEMLVAVGMDRKQQHYCTKKTTSVRDISLCKLTALSAWHSICHGKCMSKHCYRHIMEFSQW